jgi:hypothetical protein
MKPKNLLRPQARLRKMPLLCFRIYLATCIHSLRDEVRGRRFQHNQIDHSGINALLASRGFVNMA